MMRVSQLILMTVFMLLVALPSKGQRDVVMSQYMHNRYAVNTAFAGNREVLSLYGGYRQKWLGFNGAPGSMLFSMHTALKKEQMALGLQVFNQQYGVNKETGFSLAYTYRLKMPKGQKLAFSINGGGVFYNAQWTDVDVYPGTNGGNDDPEFAANESNFAPAIGFGTAWYAHDFFLGVSIPNFFYFDPYSQGGENTFALERADYLLTAGYLFSLKQKWHLQPSVLARVNPEFGSFVDVNASVIYNNQLWMGVGYRSTKDLTAMMGYQITPQFRLSYSYDYSTGHISSYNHGSHELAIQYDFGFRVKSSSPKFF
ncbi:MULTISPECIES: PorP/SprF family type IX secretion system membrane protein [unclassified Carboxylicivirga]|uniref:PorP/SprF family type IX secretion system membrane protein n=1 Tax=Carboxylicivirga TaxID=1628153 RepID=UPI003D328AAC